jgi:hypothetical protein
VVIVKGVYVVGDLGAPVTSVQDRAPDPVSLAPTGFDRVPELSQTWGELSQHIITMQSSSLFDCGHARLDGANLSDERLNPSGRAMLRGKYSQRG